MGGLCCCFATETPQANPPQHPAPEENAPLAPNNAAAPDLSSGLLVDTNLDTSNLDTFVAPPDPIPFDKYVSKPPTPSGNRGTSGTPNVESTEQINTTSSLETKVKNLKSDEKDIEMVTQKQVDDEKSDELKKSTEAMPPLQDEEDCCPICLEDYDEENPKITSKCSHHFHLSCIFEWMERSETCAVCGREMVLDHDAEGIAINES